MQLTTGSQLGRRQGTTPVSPPTVLDQSQWDASGQKFVLEAAKFDQGATTAMIAAANGPQYQVLPVAILRD